MVESFWVINAHVIDEGNSEPNRESINFDETSLPLSFCQLQIGADAVHRGALES